MNRYEQDILKLRESSNYRTLPDDVPSSMLNLSSNDYLGLNDDESLWLEFRDIYDFSTQKMSSCSSRLLTGNHSDYRTFEHTLSNLYANDKHALVFPSGYHANIGILPALMGKRDLIVADKLSHASLIDGLRLGSATVERFNHNDMRHLRLILEKHRTNFEECIIVTESIFSMDGDIAPLHELVEIKKEFNTMLYVDEAHAFGVRGSKGEGVCGELGILPDVDVIVATLGKAIASSGAFCMVSDIIRQYLINHCRSMIFTTGLAPINVAWSNFITQKLPDMQPLRDNLLLTAKTFAKSLESISRSPLSSVDSQIVPFVTGSNESAVLMAKALRDGGFYVLPIRYPTVPMGKARLRFSLKANINFSQLQGIADIIKANEALLDK